jgi:site-specific recombinase XerC
MPSAADGIRATTIGYYEKLVRLIRGNCPTAGPADVTPAMAEGWKRAFVTTETRRGKLPSPHSVYSLVRGFRSLWSWFLDELGVCDDNPWESVEPPKTDKIDVKVIEDDALTHFLAGSRNATRDGSCRGYSSRPRP